MALTKCPECNHDVSDKAQSCPHCGYVMSSQSSIPPVHEPKPTKVGEQQKNMASGSVGTIAGMALIVVGILSAFVILPFGIVLVVVGAIVLTKGNAAVVGTHQITCPYCGATGTIETPAQSYRCPACGKRSVKREGYMHPVK